MVFGASNRQNYDIVLLESVSYFLTDHRLIVDPGWHIHMTSLGGNHPLAHAAPLLIQVIDLFPFSIPTDVLSLRTPDFPGYCRGFSTIIPHF
jgi:hypothetical protein